LKRTSVCWDSLAEGVTWHHAPLGSSRRVGPGSEPSAAFANSSQLPIQHYGPDTYNKNFIYSGDNWLFVERWEHLIANRAHVDMVEVLTWSEYVIIPIASPQNAQVGYIDDYGESHYIGPIEGAQPMSEAWVNGFDHQGASSIALGF